MNMRIQTYGTCMQLAAVHKLILTNIGLQRIPLLSMPSRRD